MTIQPLGHNAYMPMEDRHLTVVVNDEQTRLSVRQPPEQLPNFEDLPVIGSGAKISSVKAMNLGGASYGIDEVVKLVVEAQVTGIGHESVEDQFGLVRMHRLKVLSAVLVDWNLDMESLRDDL